MKRFIIWLLAYICVCDCVVAQMPENVRIENLKIIKTRQDSLSVSFELITKHAVGGDYRLILLPSLNYMSNKVTLPMIEVAGHKKGLLDARQMMSGKNAQILQGVVRTSNFHRMSYKVTLPYYEWMSEATFDLEITKEGCCSAEQFKSVVLLQKAVTVFPPLVPRYVNDVKQMVLQSLSVGDHLSRKYDFVSPISQFEAAKKKTVSGDLFDLNMPLNMGKGITNKQQSDVERFIENNEPGSLKIYFPVAKTVIDRYFWTNNKMLVELVSALKAIEASENSRVVKIVIVGFASPEGLLVVNDRIAWKRAIASKEFILNNSKISVQDLLLFNGSENWTGLRKLVEKSDMPQKSAVLDIIDRVPVLQGRERKLMDLSGGNPYRYMLKNYFPELRNAAYIKVYYQNSEGSNLEVVSQITQLIEAKKYHEAIPLLLTIVESSWRDNLLGVCYMMSGDSALAKDFLEKAIIKGNSDAQYNLDELDKRD